MQKELCPQRIGERHKWKALVTNDVSSLEC